MLLSGHPDPALDTIGVQLLHDIRSVFDATGVDRYASVELVRHLSRLPESPWGQWDPGQQAWERRLASLLRPFGVRSKVIRLGERTPRGYLCEDFADAFDRYLPPVCTVAGERNIRNRPTSESIPEPHVADVAVGPSLPEESNDCLRFGSTLSANELDVLDVLNGWVEDGIAEWLP
jgi:hypothetical protein